jgi:4-amino-4-deoxy-L-arabinose transferase-like glycosyltransferase
MSRRKPTSPPPSPSPVVAPVAPAERDLWPLFLLAAAFLSGLAFMAPIRNAGPLVLDEYGTFWLVDPNSPLTLWERSLHYENIPPLMPLIQRTFLALFGESELVFRLPSVLCYLAAIPAVYVLGRDLGNPTIGSLAALLTAWRTLVVLEVRVARVYGLALLLSVLAFHAVVRWLREPESRRWAFAWAVYATGLLWTHYLNGAVVALQFLVLCQLAYRGVRATRLFFVSSLVVFLGSVPLWPALLRMAEEGQYFGFQTDRPIWEDVRPLWWIGLPLGWLVARIVNQLPWGGNLPVVATWPPVSLWIWGALPAVLVPIVCEGSLASLENPRYRIGFAATGACFVVWLICHNVRRPAAVAGVLATIAAITVMAERPPWSFKRLGSYRAVEWRQMARLVQRRGVAGEPIFVQSGLGEGFLVPAYFEDEVFHDYTACRMGRFYLKTPHPRYALPFMWNANFDVLAAYYRGVIDKHRQSPVKTLWVACATDTDLNVASLMGIEHILRQAGARELDRHTHTSAVLVRYTLDDGTTP